MRDTAKEYWLQGCNIILLSGKQPLQKWERWQTQSQTVEEFDGLPWDKADAFAIVCGLKLSNGLYIGAIDLDVKKVPEETIERGREFEKHLRITHMERTPSNGKHLIFLSRTPVKSVNMPGIREFCGVELLGENRLCIMAPSKGYVRLNDSTPTEIASLNDLFENTLRTIGYKISKPIQPQPVEFHGKTRLTTPKRQINLGNREETSIANFLAKYWQPSRRNQLELYFLGWAMKRGIVYESAARIIDAVTTQTQDEEKQARLALVKYHYQNRGSMLPELKGISGLREIVQGASKQ